MENICTIKKFASSHSRVYVTTCRNSLPFLFVHYCLSCVIPLSSSSAINFHLCLLSSVCLHCRHSARAQMCGLGDDEDVCLCFWQYSSEPQPFCGFAQSLRRGTGARSSHTRAHTNYFQICVYFQIKVHKASTTLGVEPRVFRLTPSCL